MHNITPQSDNSMTDSSAQVTPSFLERCVDHCKAIIDENDMDVKSMIENDGELSRHDEERIQTFPGMVYRKQIIRMAVEQLQRADGECKNYPRLTYKEIKPFIQEFIGRHNLYFSSAGTIQDFSPEDCNDVMPFRKAIIKSCR